MAAIDSIELTATQISMATVRGQDAKDFIRTVVAQYLWAWYADNLEKAVHKISILGGLWKYTIRVKDLKPLFILLLGPRP